jgi:hypothetical protein
MLKQSFYLVMLAALAMPAAGALAQFPDDDHLWEHHREHCERLASEERDLRVRLDLAVDHEEREHIDHRLHEIAEDRDRECRRD